MSSFTGYLDTRWLDDNTFQVLSPFRFDYGELDSGFGVFVPSGTITDLMSLPKIMRAVVTRTTSGSIASVVHDIAYRTGEMHTYTTDPRTPDTPEPLRFGPSVKISRNMADVMLYDALVARDFNKVYASSVYAGLVVGGWVAWNRYRKQDKQED